MHASEAPSPGSSVSRIVLPEAPADLAGAPVAVWRQPVEIDTYEPLPPDRYPMFLDQRVYQGSSGTVYPLPFHGRVQREKHARTWDAVHLENRWLRLMVLPELGGRIHVGHARVPGHDFFYRNNVIKPALVGLAGPWISGGVEFNWPQHHRPATFLPTDVEIEHLPDGPVTVWCSDHEPFHRMKGMHGITIRPDSALIELKVRLHNRTDDVQTFLWWANVAARVHDGYQSFFPEDVTVVADHARRATTTFPRATGRYYGVDYPGRVSDAHPDADRLDWYHNIPVPTSYMCVGSRGDFFGGYDHVADAGFVHWADHRIAPGKKQWTWGNERFGRAWERNLTDGDGPYVELMAGVYTDNQPDFSFLAPGETKAFSQYWYPITGTGPVQRATTDVALRCVWTPGSETAPGLLDLGLSPSAPRSRCTLRVEDAAGDVLWSTTTDVDPGRPFREAVPLPTAGAEPDLHVVVVHDDVELVRWQSRTSGATPATAVDTAVEPLAPQAVGSVEELYLTGLHLAQYRHATRDPDPYWEEALVRDPGDSRSATALAARAYGRGQLDRAEQLLRRAVDRLTTCNANPYDGEPHYRLGSVLHRQGRRAEAYDAWAKAAWTSGWRAPAQLAMAREQCVDGRWADAVALLDGVLAVDAHNLAARNLRVLALRRLGRPDDAEVQLAATLALDPLDWWARDLRGDVLTCDARTHRDIALDHARAGFHGEALRLLDAGLVRAAAEPHRGQLPLLHYHRAGVLDSLGRPQEASAARRHARSAVVDHCFPHGLDDESALRTALDADPDDGRAAGLLGHLLYDCHRPEEAMAMWQRAVTHDPHDAVCWRNLAIAHFNVRADPEAARRCFAAAVAAAPDDSRLLYERDQLAKRSGELPADRLERLRHRTDLVAERDDLTIEYVHLLVQAGADDDALRTMRVRAFQPWEGGEGEALAAWERVHLCGARNHAQQGDPKAAEALLRAALDPPVALGEGPHLLANRSDLWLALGDALDAQGRCAEAAEHWTAAATFEGDFVQMSPQPYGEKTYFSAAAWRRLQRPDRAEELLLGLRRHADELADDPGGVDFFATSLPALLLFADDLVRRRGTTARYLRAQAAAGLSDGDTARRLLGEVLARDPHHAGATDLQREIDGSAEHPVAALGPTPDTRSTG